MNLELIYASAIWLTALTIVCLGSDRPKLAVVLAILAAFGYGFATGAWAYSKYHGVF